MIHDLISLLIRFFKESSEEEREHAEKLMEYQVLKIFANFKRFFTWLCGLDDVVFMIVSINIRKMTFWVALHGLIAQNKRGGKVKLQSILMPLSEYDHEEKGDALYGEFDGPLPLLMV